MTSQGSLRAAILSAISETRTSLANEVDPLAIDYIAGNTLELLTSINRANGTRHYIRPANTYTDWYTYTTRDRHYKIGAAADASLDAGTDHVVSTSGWRTSADSVVNQQRATVEWPEFPRGSIVVWEHEAVPITITTSTPWTHRVEYPDYTDDPTLVVASSGSTVTRSLVNYGYGAKISLTVASGTATVSSIAIHGREAVRLPARTYTKDDSASQAAPRGVRAGPEVSGDLVGSLRSGEGLSQHVVWRYASPTLRPQVTVVNWTAGLSLDLHDVVSFTSTHLGVSAVKFEIVGLDERVYLAASGAYHFVTTLTLAECRLQTTVPFFRLNTDTCNDATNTLGY